MFPNYWLYIVPYGRALVLMQVIQKPITVKKQLLELV